MPRRISDFSSLYWVHASHESMAVYLAEAEVQVRETTAMRDRLQSAHDERKAATERGEWPTPVPMNCRNCGRDIYSIGQDNMSQGGRPLCEDCADNNDE